MAAKPKKHAYKLDWVTDHLAVGQAPMSVVQLESLREQGIDAILNLCGEFLDLHDVEAEHGFEVYYMPLADEEAPELVELEKTLEWLDEAIYLGKRVLIHCRHGIGRTGTVLNAYLLRRGLGHRLAGRTLKGLRSKPANFDQWWTIRRYGRTSKKLTVREPSLEFKHLVDLAPFFADYEAVAARVDDLVSMTPDGGCGREHTRCCSVPVRMTLVEAVYLAHRINQGMDSQVRHDLIERAVVVAKAERVEEGLHKDEAGDYCLSEAGAQCPLLKNGQCDIYDFRPLQCRTHDIPGVPKAELWEFMTPMLDKTSADLFFAFTSRMPVADLPVFSLPDVVSGRYVQEFFHLMMRGGIIE